MYLAAAWLLLQVVATIAPILGVPDSLQRNVLILIALGFPVALILAWVLELTPAGLKRDSGAEMPGRSGR